MVTGDRNVLKRGTAAHARMELQKKQIEALDVVYWGRGAIFSPLLTEGSYDVITAQDPFWRGLVAWVVARRLKARLNIQVHADLMGQGFIRYALAQMVLGQADSIRAVSEKIKKQIERMRISAPVHVLPVFIDVSKFRNLEKKRHPKFAKTILWIGRLEREKDPAQALGVLEQARKRGADAGLIFLGSGSLEAPLRAQAKPLGGYVEFAGWQDPAPYLAMADVVLSTSPHESYGASIVEALAAGVPVVSYDVGIAREAGARIASRGRLADAVVEVFQTGARGELKIPVLSEVAWAEAWQQTL